MKTKPAIGWGMRIDGPRPYLDFQFSWEKKHIKADYTCHRPVRVALVPLAEWKRLKRLENEKA